MQRRSADSSVAVRASPSTHSSTPVHLVRLLDWVSAGEVEASARVSAAARTRQTAHRQLQLLPHRRTETDSNGKSEGQRAGTVHTHPQSMRRRGCSGTRPLRSLPLDADGIRSASASAAVAARCALLAVLLPSGSL